MTIVTGVCGVTASKQLIQTEPASTARAKVSAASIFLVKIPAAKPYVVLLARSMTSSSVLNFRIDCTGPKICKLSKKLLLVLIKFKSLKSEKKGGDLPLLLRWSYCQRHLRKLLVLRNTLRWTISFLHIPI